ncbi:MAG: polysaccharide deacetylase family protein [Bacilli bacterium]|nr:polysaccharide deacetylase family protein [Bacilli bacterium]
MKKKRKIRYDRIIKIIVLPLLLFIIMVLAIKMFSKISKKEILMTNFINKEVELVESYAADNNLNLDITYEYSESVTKDYIISQSISENTVINDGDDLNVVVSLGQIDRDVYEELGVNELGKVPIMMYHGIHNLNNSDTAYVGGNVDIDGYQRTTEAFKDDLEFYYENGYRMIRLIDYVNGDIDVELGKSPIVLTFDDGLKNNIFVKGLDEEGNIIIDENSAVGILEAFKKKHPDFNVTATFFVNGELFEQPEYNEKIIEWLIDNGYDVGNHTYSHGKLNSMTTDEVQEEIGSVYQKLNAIVPGEYVNIVALPFGIPYSQTDNNFAYILNGSYNNISYSTVATLRVGWESNYSPFSSSFDKTYIKRIRAYDNNGEDFDIEMNFKVLESSRYISDGDVNMVVIKDKDSIYLNSNVTKNVIKY